ncbi:hypothetical protein [Nodosilinea sp. P-1105]|nr:hypothetical protein [Nodosilinea sp. P-1105]
MRVWRRRNVLHAMTINLSSQRYGEGLGMASGLNDGLLCLVADHQRPEG